MSCAFPELWEWSPCPPDDLKYKTGVVIKVRAVVWVFWSYPKYGFFLYQSSTAASLLTPPSPHLPPLRHPLLLLNEDTRYKIEDRIWHGNMFTRWLKWPGNTMNWGLLGGIHLFLGSMEEKQAPNAPPSDSLLLVNGTTQRFCPVPLVLNY